MLDTLVSLGLTHLDAEIYVFLAKKVSQGYRHNQCARNIQAAICNSLRSLKAKGIIVGTPTRPILYSAISIERVLDEFMKAKMEQAKTLQASRKELLSTWRSMVKKDSANS